MITLSARPSADTDVRAMAEKFVQVDFDEFYGNVKTMDTGDSRLKQIRQLTKPTGD